jgi:molecular chaperone IbpA
MGLKTSCLKGDNIMTRLTTFDLNKITPYAVGFDSIIADMFQYAQNNKASSGYPPYNIRKDGNKFQIEIALAGVRKEDLNISTEDGKLEISHNPEEVEQIDDYVHRGIAQRKFSRIWTLADNVVVNGATMENGMLYIELERIVPDEMKPRTINID